MVPLQINNFSKKITTDLPLFSCAVKQFPAFYRTQRYFINLSELATFIHNTFFKLIDISSLS